MHLIKSAANLVRLAARHLLRPIRPFLDDFLRSVPGVIHIGASSGQEREIYDKLGLKVIWVEAIPNIFDELVQNIAHLNKQSAICAVLTDQDNQVIKFNVASNNGESSSILPFKNHLNDRPDIRPVQHIELRSRTLKSIVDEHKIELAEFPALVIDVQGAELLVLKGASQLLTEFKYIKAEASEGEPYEGCCTPDELVGYLAKFGFKLRRKVTISQNTQGQRSFDLVFKRARTR